MPAHCFSVAEIHADRAFSDMLAGHWDRTTTAICAYCSVHWPIDVEKIPTISVCTSLPICWLNAFRAARGRGAEEGFVNRSAATITICRSESRFSEHNQTIGGIWPGFSDDINYWWYSHIEELARVRPLTMILPKWSRHPASPVCCAWLVSLAHDARHGCFSRHLREGVGASQWPDRFPVGQPIRSLVHVMQSACGGSAGTRRRRALARDRPHRDRWYAGERWWYPQPEYPGSIARPKLLAKPR